MGDPTDPSSTNADARVYIAYSHFEGDLLHDPILGISSIDEGDDTVITDTTVSDDPTSSTSDVSDDESTEDDSYYPYLPILIGLFAIIPIIRQQSKR